MMNKHNTNEPQAVASNGGSDTKQWTYTKPVLIAYGDVRDITLGPTDGLGESGCECARRDGPGGGMCPVDCSTIPGFP